MMRTKRWLALMLTVVMVISMIPATAAAAQSFAKTRSWSDGMFTDISADAWYYDSVKDAYELSLMSGDTGGTFRPDGQVTLAETVTVAARIHSIAATGGENFVQGTPWYQVYVDYCLANGILSEEPADLTKAATRLEFARILAKALPESDLEPINTIDDGAIPDVADDAAVYLLYRAGILTGNDAEGTFAPESSIKRSEVSAIVARMALPEQRKAITLTSDVVLTVPADDDEPSAPAAPEAMPEVSSIPGITFIPQVPAVPDSGSDPAEPPAASVPNEPSEPLNSSADTSVPFDLQYPDLIAEGAVDFSSEKITIKLESEPSGAMQQQLQDAGVTSLELLFDAGNGVWYIAYITGDVSEVLASVREIDGVISAEYDYAYSTQTIVDCMPEEVDADVHGNAKLQDQWYLRSCGIQNGWKHLKRHHHGHSPEEGSDEEEIEADENVGIAGDNVIVAVIDTGVDYTHPDLIDNIWVNPNEIPDNGIDDDNNGYVDDYYGVDITTGKGSGMDDNGHGTHVAGIIAAANNNMGVVGVAYNAKIMPIKAGQASGYFNATDIAKAIIYAHDMGAQVINMSFGGIAMTSAVEEALAYAFTDCVLVAAAGNDGKPNEDTDYFDAMPSYPAAYSYVLGVMSVDENGKESGFTNWDAVAFNSVEYELYAPGSQMISTIPNGKYATWSGTSMAAPVVSGIAALLRANFYDTDTYPTRFIYGQLSATGTETATCLNPDKHTVNGMPHNLPKIVDAYQAMTVLPNPEIGVYDYMIFDTEGLMGSEVNNGDGIIDAGETIAIGFTLKNRWGKSNDTTVTVNAISQGGIADPRIEVLTPSAEYGSVGTYSTGDAGYIKDGDLITGLENPIYLKIADDCPNDAIITLNVTVTATNGLDENDTAVYSGGTKVNLDVRNGVILPDLFTEDTVLEGGKLYIIPNATSIHEGVTVTVKPGARIQFWADDEEDAYATKAITYLNVEGTLLFEGTADEPIEVFPSERFGQYRVEINEVGSGTVKMWHTKVVNPYLVITYAEGCEFVQNYTSQLLYYRYLDSSGTVKTGSGVGRIFIMQVKDSAYIKLGASRYYEGYSVRGYHDGCIFVDSNISFITGNEGSYKNCVFLGNNNYMGTAAGCSSSLSLSSISDLFDFDNENYPVQIVTNEETGTTYLAVYGSNRVGYSAMRSAQSFAKNLGGTLACINTQEELDFICEHFRSYESYAIGLKFDPEYNPVWADGTEFEDFVTLDNATSEPAWAYFETKNPPQIYTCENLWFCYIYYLFELPGEIYVQNITLAESEITLDTEDEGYLIEATLEPATAEYDLRYSSADENVAVVSKDGVITPMGAGETVITVSSSDGVVSATMTVTVTERINMQSVELGADMTIAKDSTYRITPVVTPDDTTERLTYTSSDESVATVNENGLVTANAVGETVITATCRTNSEIYDTVTVKVVIPVESVTAEDTKYLVSINEADTVDIFGITLTPEDTTQNNIIWESSNPEVVDVDESGNLVKASCGTAVLRATAEGTDLYTEVTVFVTDVDSEITVVQMQEKYGNEYVIALLDDGTLWYWGEEVAVPTKLPFEGVRQFCYGYHNHSYRMYILDDEGTLNEYAYTLGSSSEPSLTNYFNNGEPMENVAGIDISSVGSATSHSYYAALVDGSAYAWGYNGYGQLGDGSTTTRNTAVPMEMTGIKDIAAVSYSVYLLDSEGCVYHYGQTSTGSGTTATFIMDGVTGFDKANIDPFNGSARLLTDTESITYYNAAKSSSRTLTGDENWTTYSQHFYTEDDSTYVRADSNSYGQAGTGTTSSSSAYKQVLTIGAADDIFIGSNNAYFQYDGKLYSAGLNSANQLGNLTKEAKSAVPSEVYFGVEIDTDAPEFTSEGVTDGILVIDADQALVRNVNYAAISLKDSSGNAVTIEKSFKLDKIYITPENGWTEDETYTLTIPATAFKSIFDVVTEACSLEITIDAAEEADEETVEEESVSESLMVLLSESEIEELAEEESEEIEETEKDRFYWTAEKFEAKFKEFLKEGESFLFSNNAIINRTDLVVDSDVERWLRIAGASSSTYGEHPISGNYWGTTNEELIGHQILDYNDYKTLVDIHEGKYLTEAPEDVWPFVVDAWLTNKDDDRVAEVGNETLTFHVKFNRDMDTSIPLNVRFGSDYPYADYSVSGEYVDGRNWKGTITLSTFIAGGYQCWTISNGRAADETFKKLYTDWGRFAFKVDTATAMAMTLQGNATDTGIELTWYQDDFDTLAGYNVYRSENGATGLYTRLNATIIPADEPYFVDDNVEPGKEYCYNFTVVQTDMSESQPSNAVTLVSKDTMPPSLIHTPVAYATEGYALTIDAVVTDNLKLDSVQLYFRVKGAEEWTVRDMACLNDKYSAIIQSHELNLAGMEYYITAYDGVSTTYKGTANEPYSIIVREALNDGGLGDVDGDGSITILDAYRVLQAANGQINITDEEEFARADLNGNGTLSSAEALRILMYVNGDVGTLKMDA